jgi:hypothetical protein
MKKKLFLFILILNLLVPTACSFYSAVFCDSTTKESFLVELLKSSEEESKETEDESEKEKEKEKNFISIQVIVPFQCTDSNTSTYYYFDCKALSGNQQILSPPPKN